MTNCNYKKTLVSGEEWECSLEALQGEELCYWHKKEYGKEPTQEMLNELEEKKIFDVYLQGAKLREADLVRANLQQANLIEANLNKANLALANLQQANLRSANLQQADLLNANLNKADLVVANLRQANLAWANLQQARLNHADLCYTDLHGVRFNSETVLEDAVLIDANLYRSYFDETKSFRYAKLFGTETDKEINEIVGDTLGKKTKASAKKSRIFLLLKPCVLNLDKIVYTNTDVATKILEEEGLIRYVGEGDRIIFFDRSTGCAIKNPENRWRRKENLVRMEGLSDLIIKDDKIQPEFIYKGSRARLFEISYEIYNNLYNFYVANGRLDKAAHVHYRRGEAHRKWLREKGGFHWLKSWIFDFFVLRLLTGYGDKIMRLFFASITVIAVFAVLFRIINGIIKKVNGELVSPSCLDYIYHSITTFTSLGYSNIQPNLAVGHLPQVLVAVESVLGILLMALIIFVVTYQVSR